MAEISWVFGANASTINYKVYMKEHGQAADDFVPIGECTADSIANTYEPEDTVELNISGEINISSRGTIAFDIVNITTANINELKSLDKTSVDVMLETVENVETEGEDSVPRYMIVRGVIFNYQHNFTGGEVNTLPVSLTKVVSSPDGWDLVTNTMPTDHPNYVS